MSNEWKNGIPPIGELCLFNFKGQEEWVETCIIALDESFIWVQGYGLVLKELANFSHIKSEADIKREDAIAAMNSSLGGMAIPCKSIPAQNYELIEAAVNRLVDAGFHNELKATEEVTYGELRKDCYKVLADNSVSSIDTIGYIHKNYKVTKRN